MPGQGLVEDLHTPMLLPLKDGVLKGSAGESPPVRSMKANHLSPTFPMELGVRHLKSCAWFDPTSSPCHPQPILAMLDLQPVAPIHDVLHSDVAWPHIWVWLYEWAQSGWACGPAITPRHQPNVGLVRLVVICDTSVWQPHESGSPSPLLWRPMFSAPYRSFAKY